MKVLTPNPPLLNKLNRLKKRPEKLYYKGVDPNTFAQKPLIAIVGTRKPTPYGKAMTEKIVAELAQIEAVIVSGLAFGVDVIAHRAALGTGLKTIAVLPSGVENVYPASNRPVAADIEQQGCLLSEYTPDHKPRKAEFIERNSIIAALSDAVIIPEAAERSGSLSTARRAKMLGVPVFAFPGQTNSTLSSGTNELIKRGDAQLITCANDVIKALGLEHVEKKPLEGSTPLETALLQTIQAGTGDITLIDQAVEADITDIQTALTMLEIAGKIEQNEIGIWQLTT